MSWSDAARAAAAEARKAHAQHKTELAQSRPVIYPNSSAHLSMTNSAERSRTAAGLREIRAKGAGPGVAAMEGRHAASSTYHRNAARASVAHMASIHGGKK